jgi:hypothetical protein
MIITRLPLSESGGPNDTKYKVVIFGKTNKYFDTFTITTDKNNLKRYRCIHVKNYTTKIVNQIFVSETESQLIQDLNVNESIVIDILLCNRNNNYTILENGQNLKCILYVYYTYYATKMLKK